MASISIAGKWRLCMTLAVNTSVYARPPHPRSCAPARSTTPHPCGKCGARSHTKPPLPLLADSLEDSMKKKFWSYWLSYYQGGR